MKVAQLEGDLRTALARLNIEDPLVTIQGVPSIQRQASGKLKRFIPLG